MAKLKTFQKNVENMVEGSIVLKLPIKIRETVNNDGYVITDSNNIEHFFYNEDSSGKKLNGGLLDYDGFCCGVD